MPTFVSLCMIVKNEETALPQCLGPVLNRVHEVVVVDTGSTDGTRRVAAKLGARVFDFAWCDDFSAARNESLRHAQGQWILWLDADDRLDAQNCDKLSALLANLPRENVAFIMRCRSTLSSGTVTVVEHPRLFRNDPRIRWRHRVHEQIAVSIMECGDELRGTDIVIDHVGYTSPESQRDKWHRNLRLLELEAAERPDDPAVWFYLGSTHRSLGQHDTALRYFERIAAFDRSTTPYSMPYLPRVRHYLATACQGRGELARAEHLWLAALNEDPQYGPAWQGLGGLYVAQERWAEAEQLAERMASDHERDLDVAVLRARIHLGRKEFSQARELMESAIVRWPQALWPREVLSHALLFEGRNTAAAEQSLRDILALDPHNAGALQNLAALRQNSEQGQ